LEDHSSKHAQDKVNARPCLKKQIKKNNRIGGWGGGSVVEHFSSKCETLSSIPSNTANIKKNKQKKKKKKKN
jgi:phage-related protein